MRVTFFSPHSGLSHDGCVAAPTAKIAEIAKALNGLTLDVEIARTLIDAGAATLRRADVSVRSDSILVTGQFQDADDVPRHCWRVIRFRPAP